VFLNRRQELAALQSWWNGGQPELITVYGRRQVGKTDLLVQFLADKPTVYFYADRRLLADHLRAFTEQVLSLIDDALLRLQPFTSWEAAITYVLRLAEQRRIAVVIDEFSYAVDADPSLPSVIQRLWDGARRNMTKACFIFCTSFTEAIERHFTIDGPLYRRRTRQLPVEPFSYREALLFFPHWPLLDRLQAWGIVGGVPSYLQALQGETLAAAVTEHILEKTAVLYAEAEVLLNQEVRGVGPALLRAMLAAIAYGCTEPNEIGQRVGRPVTSLSGALRFLVDYGLLTRHVPFTVANPERTRSTHYYLADNYLAFWFRFVLPNRSLLEQGEAAVVWRTRIEPNFSTYMGLRFEDVCRQFIRLQPHRWTHPISDLGVWWRGNDELEIVGLDAGQVVLVAEAKWTNEPVGMDVLRNLQRRVALLPRVAGDRQLVLFAKESFTDAVCAVQDTALALYTAADLMA
jgi:uncharacterized protein